MNDNIIAVQSLSSVTEKPVANKPFYLITLSTTQKKSDKTVFLAMRMDMEGHFIKVVGYYPESESIEPLDEFTKHIISNGVDRTRLVEVLFPNHRIVEIKNLIFKKN